MRLRRMERAMTKGEREVYCVYLNGVLVATGTASQCAESTGLKPRTIQAYAADPRRVSKWRVKHVAKRRGNDQVRRER